jgi:hypothetical protein
MLSCAVALTACGGGESPSDESGGAGGSANAGGAGGGGATSGKGGAAGSSAGAFASGGAAASGGSSAGGTGNVSGHGGTSAGGAGTSGEAGATDGGASGSSASGGASGGDAGGTAGSAGSAGSSGAGGIGIGMPEVTVDGPGIFVDGRPFHIRGVCWNPVPKGATHPDGIDFPGMVATDADLMRAAGINVVRTYEAITEPSVLDALAERGIMVLNSMYVWGGDEPSVVTTRVAPVADHPAVLAWVVGNEWNYNGLYVDLSHEESLARLNEAAALLKQNAGSRPVVTVYGEVPSAETIAAMPDIDIWGINAYRGIGFGDLFSTWASRSQKPMFLAEYGADAYNANEDRYDPESQAEAVEALTQEIADNGFAFVDGGVASGGSIFEFADEWWKDGGGSPDAHDVGGIAPGGGPHPDQTFNEEWWGLVDVDRVPRPAYDALRAVLSSLPE